MSFANQLKSKPIHSEFLLRYELFDNLSNTTVHVSLQFRPQSSRISQLLGRRCEFLITASRRRLRPSVKWIFIWNLNYILFDIFATKNWTTARRWDWFLSPTQSQPAWQSCFCALSRFYYARDMLPIREHWVLVVKLKTICDLLF